MTNFQCKACISQGLPNTTHAINVCGAVSIDKLFDFSDLKWQLAYKWHVVATIYCELEALEKLILTTPDLQNAIAAVTQRVDLHDNVVYQFRIIEDIEQRLEKENPVT
jgi:hypothetical protein